MIMIYVKKKEDNFVKIVSDILTNRRCCPT